MAHREHRDDATSAAGHAAAHAAGNHPKVAGTKGKVDPEALARMIAEENDAKGKLPRYPGLERWRLLSKMGDGAFSNVYKAVDLEGVEGEVAIKVVRKFEMNSTQVSINRYFHIPFFLCRVFLNSGQPWISRVMTIFIRILKNNQKLLRCASFLFIFSSSACLRRL